MTATAKIAAALARTGGRRTRRGSWRALSPSRAARQSGKLTWPARSRAERRLPLLPEALTFRAARQGRFQRPLTGWPQDRGTVSRPRILVVRSFGTLSLLLALLALAVFWRVQPEAFDQLLGGRNRRQSSARRITRANYRADGGASCRAARAAFRPAADPEGGAAAALRRHGADPPGRAPGRDVRSRARPARRFALRPARRRRPRSTRRSPPRSRRAMPPAAEPPAFATVERAFGAAAPAPIRTFGRHDAAA